MVLVAMDFSSKKFRIASLLFYRLTQGMHCGIVSCPLCHFVAEWEKNSNYLGGGYEPCGQPDEQLPEEDSRRENARHDITIAVDYNRTL